MENKPIYVIFGGEYSDWYEIGYFLDEKNATRFCKRNKSKGLYYREVPFLTSCNSEKAGYVCKVQIEKSKNGEWQIYDLNLDTFWVKTSSTFTNIFERIDETMLNFNFLITREENEITDELIEKITYDYLAELLSLGNGEVTKEAIAAMNAKFANYEENDNAAPE